VHVYGHPCDVDAIDTIAKEHGLKVIYDAAHAFGVKCHCGSVLNHGDLSVLSFHATKVFSTFEGGAIVCKDEDMKRHIDQLKNFGFTSETTISQTGINGKMNEFSAAIGLLQLKHLDSASERRREIDNAYREAFKRLKGIECIENSGAKAHNYSYFPILINENYPIRRDALYHALRDKNIYVRRYFYPLISDFPMYQNLGLSQGGRFLPVAAMAASRILCLPMYSDLSDDDPVAFALPVLHAILADAWDAVPARDDLDLGLALRFVEGLAG
jgi:dTDP-4-amino-4,6-dideoxygalactose transaminase